MEVHKERISLDFLYKRAYLCGMNKIFQYQAPNGVSNLNPMEREIRKADYFKVGQIYNFKYIGDNEAYKRQNGQHTEKLIQIDPNGDMWFRQLYSAYPKFIEPATLDSNPWSTNASNLISLQKETQIDEVHDEREYFVHSQRMSLREALDGGLVLLETIKYIFRDKSKNYFTTNQVTTHSITKDGKSGYFLSLSLPCEQNVNPNRFLQTVIFVWDSYETMKTDVRSVFPDAYFV
jgi:hypothetical protein